MAGESGHVISSWCQCESCRRSFRPTPEEKVGDARKQGQPIPCRIEIQYENGEIWRAEGIDAFLILEHWRAGEALEAIHGFGYNGPVLKKITT